MLLFGSPGLLEYTAVAWCIGAAAVRFYEEPTLARKFGAEYRDYRRAVRAWIPGFIHGGQATRPDRAEHDEGGGCSSIASGRRSHVARIKGVSSAQAGLYVKITCHFTRPSMPGSPGERRSG